MTIIFNKKNEKIKISFKYQNYIDVFDEINANKLSKHKSYNYAIETKNKILSFEFIYNLSRISLSGHPLRLNGHPFGLLGHPFRLSGHPLAFYD